MHWEGTGRSSPCQSPLTRRVSYTLRDRTTQPKLTGEGDCGGANGDGAVPELLVVVHKLVAARRALRAGGHGRRERVGHASVALEGHKAVLDLGARARDVGLDGSHVDRAALVCEARALGEADGELARLGRSVDRGTGDEERERGEDVGDGKLHGVGVEGDRKRGRGDDASSARVRAAYILLGVMHSLRRDMRGDRMKPVQLHRLRRRGVGTSTGCHDRGAPQSSRAIVRTLSELCAVYRD
jgi:hypothetical protein